LIEIVFSATLSCQRNVHEASHS